MLFEQMLSFFSCLILSNSFIRHEKLKSNYNQLVAIRSSIHFKCKQLSENESNKMIGKKICGSTLISLINYINNLDFNIKDSIICPLND